MNGLGNGPWNKGYEPSGININSNLPIYECGFIQGYEQAEKDFALTWEDIKTIEEIITTSDWYDFEINGKLWTEEFYEEVLKRFKEARK